jgi:hypothetical protein
MMMKPAPVAALEVSQSEMLHFVIERGEIIPLINL